MVLSLANGGIEVVAKNSKLLIGDGRSSVEVRGGKLG